MEHHHTNVTNQVSNGKKKMTGWTKFALLVMALALIGSFTVIKAVAQIVIDPPLTKYQHKSQNPESAYRKMTMRTYVAVSLRVPDSGVPWIDEMIKDSRIRDVILPDITILYEDEPEKPLAANGESGFNHETD